MNGAVGSFLGTKLAGFILSPSSIEGQLGFSLGSSAGAFAGGKLLAASLTKALGKTAGSFLAPGIGAFVGALAGGLIGSLFAGTPDSGVHIYWDEASGEFKTLLDGATEAGTSNKNWDKDQGSRELARGMAESARDILNGVVSTLNAGGAELLNGNVVSGSAWGQHGRDGSVPEVRFWPEGRDSSDSNYPRTTNIAEAIGGGVGHNLSQLAFIGGDLYARRAFYANAANYSNSTPYEYDPATVIGDLAIAADYAAYRENSALINIMLALNPQSAFAAGWAITLQRANELGIDRYGEADLLGGLQSLLPFELPEGTNFADVSIAWADSDTDGQTDDIVITIDGQTRTININDFAETMGFRAQSASTDYSDIRIHSGTNGVNFTDTNTSGPTGSPLEWVSAAGNNTDRADDNFLSRTSDDIFVGGSGNDTLSGKYGWDWLDGGAGDDNIDGGDGKDVLLGRAGNDSLTGGAGDDTLADGAGADNVQGGDGDDLILVGEDSDIDTLDGGAGSDTASYADWTSGIVLDMGSSASRFGDVYLSIENVAGTNFADTITGDGDANILYGRGGNDVLDGGAGDDTLAGGAGADDLRGGDGVNTASYTDALAGVAVNLGGTGTGGDAEGDTYTNIQNVVGSESGDQLQGDDNANHLSGGGGNDIFLGSAGGDTYDGGDGFDIVDYSGSNTGVVVNMQLGNASSIFDTPTSAASAPAQSPPPTGPVTQNVVYRDTVVGGEADDSLDGDAYNNIIRGKQGDDTLRGGQGHDQLGGSSGNDDLYGGDGRDLIFGGGGNDFVDGGTGHDELYGGAGEDVMHGRDGDDTLYGGSGNDQLYGQDGHDKIYAGDGQDSVFAGTGNDTVFGGEGDDLLNGGAGYDFLKGGAGNDSIFGGGQADKIFGDEGDDYLGGTAHNDTLSDGTGSDTVVGSTGSDVLKVSDDGFADIFRGGTASVDDAADTASFEEWGRGIVIDLSTADASGVTIFDGNNSLQGVENLVLTGHQDFASGDANNNVIRGLGGEDLLKGMDGNDTIYGDEESDIIIGGNGDDMMFGGRAYGDRFEFHNAWGDDTIGDFEPGRDSLAFTGDFEQSDLIYEEVTEDRDGDGVFETVHTRIRLDNAGPQQISASLLILNVSPSELSTNGISVNDQGGASAADELINGTEESDIIWAQDGNDTVFGGAGDDTIGGGPGDDRIFGGAGNDIIFAAAGDDFAAGGAGGDAIFGGDNVDTLLGGTGDDEVWGSEGDDVIYDGTGRDLLVGRGGNDKFILSNDGTKDVVNGENYYGRELSEGETLGRDLVSYEEWDRAVSIDLALAHDPEKGQLGDVFFGIDDLLLTAFNDFAAGDHKANMLIGGAGSDTLSGRDGDDTIEGGSGDDKLIGGRGNDLLIGGSGQTDTYVFETNWGHDTIRGFNPENGVLDIIATGLRPDQLSLSHVNGNTVLSDPDGTNTITILDVLLEASDINFGFSIGDDRHTNIEGVIGSAGDDTLIASDAGTWMAGGGGTDKLVGGQGDDSFVISVGDGVDTFEAKDGFDSIVIGEGAGFANLRLDNTVEGAKHITTLTIDQAGTTKLVSTSGVYGGSIEQIVLSNGYNLGISGTRIIDGETVLSGLNRIINGDGSNETIRNPDLDKEFERLWLAGWGGNDTLKGGRLNDVLHGGTGNDRLEGDEGSDTYLYSIGDGHDTVVETSGTSDTLVFDEGIKREHLSFEWVGTGDNRKLRINVNPPGEQSGSITIDTWTQAGGVGRIDWIYVDGARLNLPREVHLDPTVENTAPVSDPNTLIQYQITPNFIGSDPIASFQATDADGDPLYYNVTGNNNFWFEGNTLMASIGPSMDQVNILTVTVSDGLDSDQSEVSVVFTTGAAGVPGDFEITQTLPVVLDLDGDGVELISFYDSNVFFDMDNDGVRERTGWVGSDDGILVLDRNVNGLIDDASEISFVGDVAGANTDIEGLRAYDTNSDGKLDANDDSFAAFKIWRDVNSDGVSQSNELFSLEQLGITEISLDIQAANQLLEGSVDNAITGTVTYSTSYGHVGEAADVAFAYDGGNGVSVRPVIDSLGANIVGTDGPDTLSGGLGDDTLRGGGGADLLQAGQGNDLLIGDVSDDTLEGNIGDDTLRGNDGDDVITGGTGNDLLTGGSEADTFTFGQAWGTDTITDFVIGEDKIDLKSTGLIFSELTITQDGANARVADAGGNVIILEGITAANLTESDFVFESVQYIAGNSVGVQIDPNVSTTSQFTWDANGLTFSYTSVGNVARGSRPVETNVTTGKWYWEQTIDVSNSNNTWIGLIAPTGTDWSAASRTVSEQQNVYFYESSGRITRGTGSGRTNLYGSSGSRDFNAGDVIGIAYDADAGNLWISINGAWMNGATDADVAAGLSPTISNISAEEFQPFAGGSSTQSGDTHTVTFNFGVTAFASTPPTGFAGYVDTNPVTQAQIIGTSRDDNIVGTADAEVVSGNEGNDAIQGQDGADSLYGGAGNDAIYGQNGDDKLFGGLGNDYLNGGDGADTLDGGDGVDQADYGGSAAAVSINLATGVHSGGDATGDVFIAIEEIFGSAFNDTLVGSDGHDVFLGRDGNDSISCGGCTDALYGNAGDDQISGGDGNDFIMGQENNDSLAGDEGNDTLDGGEGNDELDGGVGNDSLSGGAGDDKLIGGAGADTLDGGTGYNSADYQQSSAAISINLATNVNTGGDAEGDILLNIGEIRGTAFNDVIVGDDGTNHMVSNGGNDTLEGGKGNEHLYGSDGAETYVFNTGDGDDRIYYFAGGVDKIDLTSTGLQFSDLTIAQSGSNTIVTYGTDTITLMGFHTASNLVATDFVFTNEIFGTAGADTFFASSAPEAFFGGGGTDYVRYENALGAVAINLSTNVHTGDAAGDRYTDIEAILATGFDDTLTGDATANELLGHEGNDVLRGEGGDDKLHGNGGDDNISGGQGNDSLRGNEGNDTLDGGEGNNALHGGEGNDSLIGGVDQDTLYGEAGADTLRGGDSNDMLFDGNSGTVDADVFDGGAGFDTIDYLHASSALSVNLTTGIHSGSAAGDSYSNVEYLMGSIYNDVIVGGGNFTHLHGRSGNDTMTGTSANETFYGGAGNDDVNGIAGNDALYGEAGADTLRGGDGNDTLAGGDDNDRFVFDAAWGIDTVTDFVVGAETLDLSATGLQFADLTITQVGAHTEVTDAGGNKIILQNTTASTITAADFVFANIVSGTNNSDTINGTAASDHIEGLDGDDKLYGHGGNDTLVGGDGRDVLRGGEGDDLLQGGNGDEYLIGDAGADTLDGGDGYDWADYSWETVGVSINLATGIHSGGAAEGDVLLNIERLYGGSGNDTLQANDTTTAIRGGAGDDLIIGGAASEYLIGDAGADTLDGGAGLDWADYSWETVGVNINLATGIHSGGAANGDVLINIERIYGGHGDDTLTGNATTYQIRGGDGNDIINSGTSSEILQGDAGSDVFAFENGWGVDTITDFVSGEDTLDLSATGLQFADLTIAQVGANTEITEAGGNKIVLQNITATDITASDFVFANAVIGTAGNESLVGTANADRIDGLAGNDTVEGGDGTDLLRGGEGNDVIYGQAGNDMVLGGAGSDYVFGGSGADTIDGGTGFDWTGYEDLASAVSINLATGVHAGIGGDVLINIEGVSGTQYNDTLVGSEGQDYLYGRAGNDLIQTGGGNDRLYSGLGVDTLDGGTGYDVADYLQSLSAVNVNLSTGVHTGGEAEGDILVDIEEVQGSLHNDSLTGDATNNVLRGADGNDTLAGGAGNDTLTGGAGTDLHQFQSGWGTDTVTDFTRGTDTIDLSSTGLQFTDLTITQVASDAVVADGHGNTITLQNVTANDLAPSDFVFAAVPVQTTPRNGEVLIDLTVATSPQFNWDANGLTFSYTSSGTGNRGSRPVDSNTSSGKWYWEQTIDVSNSNNSWIGLIAPTTTDWDGEPTSVFNQADVYFYESSGRITVGLGSGRNDLNSSNATDAFAAGDVIGIAYDADAGKLWISKNGTWIGGASDADVAAGLSPTINNIPAGTFQPFAGGASGVSGNTHTVTFNFGATAFAGTPPAGYTAYAATDTDVGNDVLGSPGNDAINGSAASDSILGAFGDDTIDGLAGNDTLDGGLGSDQLTGGTGGDIFQFGQNWGADTITDFVSGTDQIDMLTAGVQFVDLTITQVGADTQISDGAGNSIMLTGVTASTISESDFVFAQITAPVVTVDALSTTDTTPLITGTIDDPAATIEITIAGQTYTGVNAGDGTWSAQVTTELDSRSHVASIRAVGEYGHVTEVGPAVEFVTAITGAGNPLDGVSLHSRTNLTFADIDGDGDLDAFIGQFTGLLNYYENTGTAESPVYTLQTGADNPLNNFDAGTHAAFDFVDIDNDGDLDALVGAGDGQIEFWRNDGTATNPTFNNVTGGDNPFNGIDVGSYANPRFFDIDDDGDLDAFSGNSNGKINYFENTGNADVATYVERTGASNPFDGIDVGHDSSIAIADVNGDGLADALISSRNSSMSLYLNTGTVSQPVFALADQAENPFSSLALSSYAIPTLIDFDGDGYVDLFTRNTAGHVGYYQSGGSAPTITVDVEAPTLTFDSTANIQSSFPNITGTVDDPLASITLRYAGQDYAATNNGDGTWSATVAGALAAGSYTFDVFATDQAGNSGNESLVFDIEPTITLDPLNTSDTTPTITGTIDDPTAAIEIHVDGQTYAGVNNSDGTWYAEVTAPLGDGNHIVKVAATLLSGNTYIGGDIVTEFIWPDAADNPFNPGLDAGGSSNVALIDLDNDGDLDVVSGEYWGQIKYFENIGTQTAPSFVSRTGSSNPFNGMDVGDRSTITFCDLDGDGDQDAAVGSATGLVYYVRNDGTIANPSMTLISGSESPFFGIDVGDNADAAMVDIDADGDLDLFVGNDLGYITFFENTGNSDQPNFVEISGADNPFDGVDYGAATTVRFFDVEGDGDFDALVNSNNGGVARYLENVGSAQQAQFVEVTDGSDPFHLVQQGFSTNYVLGDLDGDGHWELLSGQSNGQFSYRDSLGAISLTIDTAATTVALDSNQPGYPIVTGTVGEASASIEVTLAGITYTGVNNGDGTWTADVSGAIVSGSHDFTVTATDTQGNTVSANASYNIAPVATFNGLTSRDNTPTITGTVDDPTATVAIEISGQSYAATNHGDGT